VPIGRVLQEVGDKAGVKFKLDERLATLIDAEIKDVDFDTLLAQLAPSRAVSYEKVNGELKAATAYVTAQEEPSVAPAAPAPAVGDDIPLGQGVLRNSQRPTRELYHRAARSLLLQNAVIDTAAAKAGEKLKVPAQWVASPNTRNYIVQFDHNLTKADEDVLRGAGAEICHYVPNAALSVRMEPAKAAELAKLAGVVHVEPFHPYFKMSEDVLAFQMGFADAVVMSRMEAGEFNVMSFRGAQVESAVKAAGGRVIRAQSVDGRQTLTVALAPTQLPELLRHDDVQWVEPLVPAKALNDLAVKRIRATAFKRLHPTLTGRGVIVGVTDSGVDFLHPGFALNPNLPTSTNFNTRIVHYALRASVTADGLAGDNNGHGTHVSGSVLGGGGLSASVLKAPGSGTAPYRTNQFAGMAQDARLVMIEDFNGFSYEEQVSIAYSEGARLSNNSWGNSLIPYSAGSAIWDALVRDADTNQVGRQEFIAFFAAGNSGNGNDDGGGATANTIGAPGNSKNVITVGAVEQPRRANNYPGLPTLDMTDTDWQMAGYSSRGPITPADPRAKPEIVAPGSYVLSIQSHDTFADDLVTPNDFSWDYRYDNVNTGTNYAFSVGTSMATPVTTGGGTLIYEYFTNTFGRAPSPAMMKAIMVAGARNLHSLAYRMPMANQPNLIVEAGFGLLDIERAIGGPGIRDSDQVILLDQTDTTPIGTSQIAQRQITLAPGEGSLKVVLVWSDVPGTPGNGPALVNDLDLVILAPGGTEYLGNQTDADGVHAAPFASGSSVNFGDGFNNVEMVTLRDAQPGTYTIRVQGFQVTGGDQDYALVIMKGVGIEGRTLGSSPDMTTDTNGLPLVAYEAQDGGGHSQIYVRKWVGPYGDVSDLGTWRRMQDQWFGIRNSASSVGISQLVEDSVDPSIALQGTNVYVSWTRLPQAGDTSTPDRIYLRKFDGMDWVPLANSASELGVSGAQTYDAADSVVEVLHTLGAPIVAWRQKVLTGTRPCVSYFNGTTWSGLAGSDTAGLPSASVAANIDMVVDIQGLPIVAWEEQTTQKIHVRRWNAVSWTDLGSQGLAPYAGEPSLAVATNGDLYLAWVQTPNGVGSNFYYQVYAAKYSGGVWSGMAGSTNFPGISGVTNAAQRPSHPTIDVSPLNGHVTVAWSAGTNDGNSIFVKRFNGVSWQGVYGADATPGVSSEGGVSLHPVMKLDRAGLPIVTFDNNATGFDEVLTCAAVGDRAAPVFEGLQVAMGGLSNNATLLWAPAVDEVSSTLLYRIYRGTQTFACGVTPSFNPADVFNNPIALVTNVTAYNATGLVNGLVYVFGVRAGDTNFLFDLNTELRAAGPSSGVGDGDADCLNNTFEILALTDPCIADTDGDFMQDGWEWTYSTNNPLHPSYTNALYPHLIPVDNGVENLRTVAYLDGDTNQLPDADIDGDGASTLEEYLWWLQNTHTNGACETTSPTNRVSPDPTNPDTDGDGIQDGWEIFNGLNPTINDALVDSDGDGLNNLSEFNYGSDPFNRDSDADGLEDGTEVIGGTSPVLSDTDEDGLTDGFETQIGSDPRRADSNDNTVSDGDLYQLGYDSPTNVLTNFVMLVRENFETSSRTNWRHYATSPFLPFDLWHLSTAEPAPRTNGIAYLRDRTTSTSFRVASDPSGTNVLATYSVGSALACALESPVLNATNTLSLFVSWNEFFATEANVDFVSVQARGGPNTNWFLVSTAASGQSTGWVRRTANLSTFANFTNVQVRFFFNALNAVNNNFAGWYVDDVAVYDGATIRGWVRDINGRPLQGAKVLALGRGGLTNALYGHRYVEPGKIFGEAFTTNDGSYVITGLPLGRYFVKATEASHVDEFFNGQLVVGGGTNYGFGRQLNAGVPLITQVGAGGYVDLQAFHAVTNVHFELEKGNTPALVGIMLPGSNTVAARADAQPLTVWNGLTNGAATVPYLSATGYSIAFNHPDWITNPVPPSLAASLAFGLHQFYGGTNYQSYPPPQLVLREGEVSLLQLFTNQGSGRLYVTAADRGKYRVIVDGFTLTNLTPALVATRAGPHEVSLQATNGVNRMPIKSVVVPIGERVPLVFSSNDLLGAVGAVLVQTMDIQGNSLTGASIYVDGTLVGTNDVVGGSNATPAVVNVLQPGAHRVSVRKPGYRHSEQRNLATFSGLTNLVTFILYDADEDYDLVGDATEVNSYTNIFAYHRLDDPDADGLNNRLEFDLFRLNNIQLNAFDADSDHDGMRDGDEVGYDTMPDRFAQSVIPTNIAQGTHFVRSLFVGRYLEGVDNFGTGNVAVAVACDRFESSVIVRSNDVPATINPALSVFINIPATVTERSVSQGHNAFTEILGDSRPDQVDTDGDGMWDGFEFAYGRSTTAKLDPIECGRNDEDLDYDGLSNYLEFLGVDGQANTNDWSDPTNPDTDNDGMPDGWEYFYGLDPRSALDAMVDVDGDDLVNLSEFLVGTDPRLADTDGDFLNDGQEVLIYGSNPQDIDTDDDGLTDGREVFDKNLDGIGDGGFFPNWQQGGDIDNDGFNDGPTDWDTDGDGMPDGFEVIDAFGNIRNPALNPYDPNDGDDDPDGDGLSNLQEYLVRDSLYGNNPEVFGLFNVIWDYWPDPFDPDSDGDGLPDGFEVIYGLHPMDPIPVGIEGTTFTRFPALGPGGDLDGDGLWNDREYRVRFHLNAMAVSNEVTDQSTHPWNPDTDGDGLQDGEEDRIFRTHPIRQDTDFDNLMDGTAVTGRQSEVEDVVRTNVFAFYPCTNCLWNWAFSNAQTIVHPTFTNVFGHLATITTPEEMNAVSNLITAVGTNFYAIGAWGTNDLFGFTWFEWVTHESPRPDEVSVGGIANFTPGFTNYLTLGPDLGADAVVPSTAILDTVPVDGYVVEWNLPVVTNHYDYAYNDLWTLTWPRSDTWPLWVPMATAADTPLPPGRWGATTFYNPIYEQKVIGNTIYHIMDNRQLVVVGGRDGYHRHRDVWEFVVRSNYWQKSVNPINGPSRILLDGVSEGASFTHYSYSDTKAFYPLCRCDLTYNCEATTFGLPKNRPGGGRRTFDDTFIFGGWGEEHGYQARMGTYKSTDDLRPIQESTTANASGTEFVDYLGRLRAIQDATGARIGRFQGEMDGDTNAVETCTGFTGLHYPNFPFRAFCDDIEFATVRLAVSSFVGPAMPVNLKFEYRRQNSHSINQYDTQNDIYEPSVRVPGAWFNTANLPLVIAGGGNIDVDVTALLQELISEVGAVPGDGFDGSSIGLVIDASGVPIGNSAVISVDGATLSVRHRPSYKQTPEWVGASSASLRAEEYPDHLRFRDPPRHPVRRHQRQYGAG
jgi:serine protease AprX